MIKKTFAGDNLVHSVEGIFKEVIFKYLQREEKCSYGAILLNEHAMKHVAHRLVVN